MKKLLLTIIAVFISFSVFGQFEENIDGELTTEDKVAIDAESDPDANYKLTVGGSVNIGGVAGKTLKVRHVKGKKHNSTVIDNLYLNYDTGKPVIIGRNNNHSNLIVYGGLQIGNVGIPNGFRLAVDGKIKVEEVQVQMSDFWDDVFMEETYDLMSIEEKEAYTQANKHLPSFPAEAEIIAEGMEIGEGIANTVKELEEAYRYIYQLNTAIKELQESVEEVVEINKELATENLELKKEFEEIVK